MGHQRTKIKRRASSNTARHSKKIESPAKLWSDGGLIWGLRADVPVPVLACAWTEVAEEHAASLRAWGETSISRHVAGSRHLSVYLGWCGITIYS